MNTELKVSVGNLQGKMRLTATGHTGHRLPIDYPAPLGEDDGFTSLELLMVSLAGCSGHTVQFLLGKMGKKLEELEVEAVGRRRTDRHPTVLTDIELRFRLKADGLDACSAENAIRMAQEQYCPVWNMLGNNVRVSWKYSLT